MTFSKLIQQSILWRGFYFCTILLLNIILGRLLQAELVGWLYYFSNTFSLIILIVSLSLETALGYFAAKQLIAKQALAWFSILYLFVTTVVLLLFCYFIPITFNTQLSIPQRVLYLYGASFFIGNALCNYFTSLFYVDGNYRLPQIVLIVCNATLIFLLVVINAYQLPVATILHTYFFFFLLQGIVLAFTYFYRYKFFFSVQLPNGKQIQALLNYALLIVGGNLIFFLVYRIDYWFVAYYPSSSAADVGNYIQASKMGQILLIIPQILASVVFPQAANATALKEIQHTLAIIIRLLIQFFLVLFLLNLLFGQWATTTIFGESFNTMFLWLAYLLPGILCLAILALLSAYFSGINLVKINVMGAALALVFIIIGNFIFVPTYGVKAAAITSSLGYGVNMLFALYQYKKMNKNGAINFQLFSKYDYVWLVKTIFSK